MNKIVTICGSMKFKDKMIEIAKELEINKKYDDFVAFKYKN